MASTLALHDVLHVILVDTGVLVAGFSGRDQHAPRVRDLRVPEWEILAVPAPVLFEAAYLVGSRMGPDAEARFVRQTIEGYILDPTAADYERAIVLIDRYAGLPLGLVDALVVGMAERLGVTTILTLDRRHFNAVRPAHCPGFTILP